MWRYYARDWVGTKMTTVLTFYNVVLESYISPVSYYNISSVQFSLVSQSCPTLCDPMDCSTPDLPVHHQLKEFTQTHVHWVIDAIQPSHPLSSPFLPAFSFSQHGQNYWSFNISTSNEYSGLISFRMDWVALLAVQGTVKSLLQYHSSKASILRHSAFFIIQLSYD